jgi:hypothetical protein
MKLAKDYFGRWETPQVGQTHNGKQQLTRSSNRHMGYGSPGEKIMEGVDGSVYCNISTTSRPWARQLISNMTDKSVEVVLKNETPAKKLLTPMGERIPKTNLYASAESAFVSDDDPNFPEPAAVYACNLWWDRELGVYLPYIPRYSTGFDQFGIWYPNHHNKKIIPKTLARFFVTGVDKSVDVKDEVAKREQLWLDAAEIGMGMFKMMSIQYQSNTQQFATYATKAALRQARERPWRIHDTVSTLQRPEHQERRDALLAAAQKLSVVDLFGHKGGYMHTSKVFSDANRALLCADSVEQLGQLSLVLAVGYLMKDAPKQKYLPGERRLSDPIPPSEPSTEKLRASLVNFAKAGTVCVADTFTYLREGA